MTNMWKTTIATCNNITIKDMLIILSNPQKVFFSLKIGFLGAAIGFSFMVWAYLSKVPDHLQSVFLRSQYEPSRLDGLSAVLIYGSTAISGFLIAYIFIYWLYEKPESSGVSKTTWIVAGLGYGIGNAFIGGGIFMPLADRILQAINESASIGTSLLVVADHIFRVPLTMWLYGTQVLYSSLISCFLFALGGLIIYKMHESDRLNKTRISYATISTIVVSGVVVFLSIVLPVSILQYLG